MEDFGNMQNKLEELGLETENASLQRIPINNIETKYPVDSKHQSKVRNFTNLNLCII